MKLRDTPKIRVLVAWRPLFSLIVLALVGAAVGFICASGLKQRPRSSAATLAEAIAMTQGAVTEQFAAPPKPERLAARVRAARRLWQRLRLLISRCRNHHIALGAAIVEQSEIGRVLFLKWFGPIGPGDATESLITISHRFVKTHSAGPGLSRFEFYATVSWFAYEAWDAYSAGYVRNLAAGGGLSRPHPKGRSREDVKLARKYQLICIRYALRAVRLKPTDPNAGWLLYCVPLPRRYAKLSVLGAGAFLAGKGRAKWWCDRDFYSRSELHSLAVNVRYNLKIFAPDELSAVEAGSWRHPIGPIPKWRDVMRALGGPG